MNLPPAMRIMVANHIQSSRDALCGMVAALGHNALPCAGGHAALAAIMRAPPDMVLLDLLMPDLDGFDVMRLIRARQTGCWMPVIVTSSQEGEAPFIRALQQGADDYLACPINPALLEAKLDHYARVLRLQSGMVAMVKRQEAILDNVLDAVITLSDDGVIEDSNLAATRMFAHHGPLRGLRCEALAGAPLARLVIETELQLRRDDGSTFPAELAHSQWTQAGRALHTLVLRDLTERRQFDRMKDEFLATVSHELRTPLTSVLGALCLLDSGAAGALPAAAAPLASAARRNGERLSRLIDDILDLSKLESNRMPMHLRPMALESLVQEAIKANEDYAHQAGVTLLSDYQPGSAMAEVDPDRFLQIMANLLSNAIKHSGAGTCVTVALRHTGDGVRVEVRDRGPGISEQFRSRIFEKFSQEDGTDRRVKGGTGLGLYITRMLVERMGGRIAVDSAPGQGATFSLTFEAAGGIAAGGLPRLLHIDRDADAQQRIMDWLGAHYAVDSAVDLQQARQLEPLQLAIIIADPQAQGEAYEFCAALRQMANGRPVVLYSDSIAPAFARQAGLPWLHKQHAMLDQLLAALNQLIQQKG